MYLITSSSKYVPVLVLGFWWTVYLYLESAVKGRGKFLYLYLYLDFWKLCTCTCTWVLGNRVIVLGNPIFKALVKDIIDKKWSFLAMYILFYSFFACEYFINENFEHHFSGYRRREAAPKKFARNELSLKKFWFLNKDTYFSSIIVMVVDKMS